MSSEDHNGRPSLGDELRAVTKHRILEAAKVLVPRRGLGFTVEEVAEEAGLSQRTVFRHYPTRDGLVAEAISAAVDAMEQGLIGGDVDAADPKGWVTANAVWTHSLVEKFLGNCWFEMYTPQQDFAPDVAAAVSRVKAVRERVSEDVTNRVWKAAGGRGKAPRLVIDAFLINGGGFGYQALAVSRTVTTEETGRTCAEIAWAVLQAALADQGQSE